MTRWRATVEIVLHDVWAEEMAWQVDDIRPLDVVTGSPANPSGTCEVEVNADTVNEAFVEALDCAARHARAKS